MNVTSIITFFGGLAFFLFGMFMMGDALKKVAGNRMQMILGRLASTRMRGILLGTFVTAIIQSSSATSVMVVSFVSSGIMTLTQAISVIMGANVGTTMTGWILTLANIEGGSELGALLSTTFIFAVVAVIGIMLMMAGKKASTKNFGVILVSLSVLMSGMKTMSSAMEPLQSSEAFMNIMTVVSNPLICILVGIAVAAVIQSNSASVGILQAMSMTGIIPFSVAVPMITGMSIGACVPVLISAISATKDGKRSALSYLYFNLFGCIVLMAVYAVFASTAHGAQFLAGTADSVSIAIVNTSFKVFSVIVLYPFVPQMEKLVRLSVRDAADTGSVLLDEMLLNYPAQAIERGGLVVANMADIAEGNMNTAMGLLFAFDKKKLDLLLQKENEEDQYEDKLSNFLMKLTAKELSSYETRQTAKYLHCMTDLERISDHSENIAALAQSLNENGRSFSPQANAEISVCIDALKEILSITMDALKNDDLEQAYRVEPLEEVIDALTEKLKQRHIKRLQQNVCTLETSFIFNDCINNFERVADHCSNIAVSVIELYDESAVQSHDYLRTLKQGDSDLFRQRLREFEEKYSLKLKETELVAAGSQMQLF